MRKHILIISLIFLTIACRNKNVIHLQRKNIIETVYASGSIIPKNEYNVFALVSGAVLKKYITDGDSIKKGQILYEISSTAPTAKLDATQETYKKSLLNTSENSPVLGQLKLAMQNANAKFKNDSLMYMRYNNLMKSNATTQVQLDNALLIYNTSRNEKKAAAERYYAMANDLQIASSNAKSQLASAKNDLNNFVIRAEKDGVVYKTFKESGEVVKTGELIALLGEKNDRTIKLNVDQQDIDKIKTGQEVILKTDITGNAIYNARIIKIYPVMNEADQTFRVDAVFTNNTQMPYVHTSVEANIIIQKKNNALVVPRNSMVSADSIIVRVSGKDQTRAVKTGIISLDDAEILEGADENTEVVIPIKK